MEANEPCAFSLQDYISGKALPEIQRLPLVATIQWTYGVRRGAKRKRLTAFWTRSVLDPHETTLISETILAPENDSTVPRQKAEELLARYLATPETFEAPRAIAPQASRAVAPQAPKSMFRAGSICTHNDGEGHHMALIVSVVGDMAHALFLTSSSRWNRYARLAQDSEATTLGQRGQKRSFLAPVVRPLSEFYRCTAVLEYPNMEAYRAEFAKAFASGCV